MLGTRSRAAIAGSAIGALLVMGLAGPALADDPPFDWTLVSTTTVDDVTVTWEVAESTASPFDSSVEMLDPMPVYRPNIINNSGETRTFGFGTDFVTKGVIDPLWTAGAWGAFEDMMDSSILSLFWTELAPGESYSGQGGWYDYGMPAWSGHTIRIFQLEETGVEGEDPIATPLASISTPGRFVPADLTDGDIANLSAVLGQRATVESPSGSPELVAGLSGAVSATGLPPNEVLELWIAPDLNFAYFQILGGGLPIDAIKVGSGRVKANGSLSAPFALPADLTPGNYQLVVGNRAERYWPAGSYDDFQVVEAPPGLLLDEETAEAGPGGESAGFQWDSTPVGDVTLGVTFPEGSSAGTTSSLYSSTGPLPIGFTIATDPPLYWHVSTSVSLSGPAQVCVNYDPALAPDDPPHLFHFDGVAGEWIDITDPTEIGPGYVCGLTASFSPFVLGYPDAVTFDFSGFFEPVSNHEPNIAKPGQAIPVKFSLHGDQGLDVVTSARFVLEGNATSLVGDDIGATAETRSGLSYDAKKDQYSYVWKTNKAWSLKKGHFELTLSDGSVHTFDVVFKK